MVCVKLGGERGVVVVMMMMMTMMMMMMMMTMMRIHLLLCQRRRNVMATAVFCNTTLVYKSPNGIVVYNVSVTCLIYEV